MGVVCVCAGADGVSNRCNRRESQPVCQREGKQVYWQMHCLYYSAWIVCGSYNKWQMWYLAKTDVVATTHGSIYVRELRAGSGEPAKEPYFGTCWDHQMLIPLVSVSRGW